MNVQVVVDQLVDFLKGPTGWIALIAVVGFAIFLLRSEPAR